jgi:hypothetical protein
MYLSQRAHSGFGWVLLVAIQGIEIRRHIEMITSGSAEREATMPVPKY